jgi:hypothetical protein
MLIGHGADRLEQRITNALCSGSLRSRESDLLQDISRKIGFYRERAASARRKPVSYSRFSHASRVELRAPVQGAEVRWFDLKNSSTFII